MGRMLIVQEYRPDIAPSTESAIKRYEMSVIARMFCGVDGALYIPKDKYITMKSIIKYSNRTEDLPNGELVSLFEIDEPEQDDDNSQEENILEDDPEQFLQYEPDQDDDNQQEETYLKMIQNSI